MNINWHKVAKYYNGIAIIPNPAWYFPIGKKISNIDLNHHMWLRMYDVSSLVIWKNSDNTIIKYVNFGKISNLIKQSKDTKKNLEYIILSKINKI